MTRPDQIAEMVAQHEAAFGTLDILVNNAGIQHVSPIEEFPIDKWDAIIAINLSSAFHTIRAAIPGMKVRKWGRIINTASAHSLAASPFKAAYVSAKHGLAGLTKTAALELATFGVTVNRPEEHTSELQSLNRISFVVFCLKKKRQNQEPTHQHHPITVRSPASDAPRSNPLVQTCDH